MTAGFIRRYLSDPGLEEITKIEGVVIIDADPRAAAVGLGNGTALCVAEFEDGPFNEPFEVASAGDLARLFGGFGFTYAGVVANHPCARVRRPDGAIAPQYWNGNGYTALANKRFNRLVVTRVDTSVGSVLFTRLAALSGANSFNWDLEPGQQLGIKINGAASVPVVFNAAVATLNSVAGTYPTTFTGGEWIEYTIDGVAYRTTFLAGDQSQAQVVARLNATVGANLFSVQAGNVTRLVSVRRGTGAAVQITAISGAIITTATGFSVAAATNGTGDAANIDQVTDAEASARITAVVSSARFERDGNGNARIVNTGTPGTGTIEIEAATTTITAFGFPTGVVANAASGIDGIIPAGTRVRTAGGTEFVTMRSLQVLGGNAGPYRMKVRHGLDDGTGVGAAVATVNLLTAPIDFGAFSVLNDLPITNALTEAQIDAVYTVALAATLNPNTIAKDVNLSWAARTSNVVRNTVRSNAIDASRNGLRGRLGAVSPPLGTTRAVAKSTSAQPGVGAYRSDRIVYAYPEVCHFISSIALRGIGGGAGFTEDGIIDSVADAWVVSTCSQVPPEENPGQETDAFASALGLGRDNPDIQNMDMNDYVAFKSSGIAALRFSGGAGVIQSGVVSVDPVQQPGRKNIARRRMADFVQDSLAEVTLPHAKKPNSETRRGIVFALIDSFMTGLVRDERMASQHTDAKSANSPDTIAAGVFYIDVLGRTLSSMDDIVLRTELGENVITFSEI